MPKNHSNTVHKKNWKNKVHTSNIIPSQYTRTRVASILSFHNRILFFSRSTMYIVLYIKGPNNCESVGEKLGHQTEEPLLNAAFSRQWLSRRMQWIAWRDEKLLRAHWAENWKNSARNSGRPKRIYWNYDIFGLVGFSQGMYKNWIENDRIFFEIPTLLSCEWGNPEQENSKYHIFFEFPAPFSAEFPCLQDKRVGISKILMLCSTLFLYIPWFLWLSNYIIGSNGGSG